MNHSSKRTLILSVLIVATFAAAAEAVSADPAALRSPWDTKPATRERPGFSCGKPTLLPTNIEATSFYSDQKKSVIDPAKYAAYQTARSQFAAVMDQTEKAADTFRATGNRGAAACVLEILDAEAEANAMTGTKSSNQAYYVQNWTLGALAVSWLKVRIAEPGTAAQRKAALDWLETNAGQTRTYFTERHAKDTKDGTNNHYYWAGFAVMATGIVANNQSFYDWGKSTFDYAASCVQPDGTLPLEMDRGQRALHYHLFALAPIVMMAEFGNANGEGLYANHDSAVQRLVTRTFAGLLNNGYFTEKAGTQQDTPGKDGVKSTDVIWLVPYLKRFPNPTMSKVLQSVELHRYDYLGGLPPN
jgi:poly(beta-D-mannuronate) lyase